MNHIHSLTAPIGRLLLAIIFIMSGLNKIGAYGATQGYMEAMGVPGGLLPLVIALEVLGGLALVIGWQARWAALLLAGFSLLSALLFHGDISDQISMIMLMKNVSIAGGLLMVFAHGAGAYAVDNYRSGIKGGARASFE
ncbi:DoxX family protein [Shewanella sp. NIFS-20-20]|uniref:DoxX family protein n=1 Tax=Shewanella sp. NIFS-20-20 TaxID=2853806 RepID=UPI001C45BD52|nr:DoxX family protein [Shewanella sp. NIFS-20-20]MBV7315369.1 DoxX family protein [Shewanella sp. NIFS-20-20]